MPRKKIKIIEISPDEPKKIKPQKSTQPQREKINKIAFEKFCEMHMNATDIADAFEVSDDTLTRWCKDTYSKNFAECKRQLSAKGKAKLYSIQWMWAKKSERMAIWLGKQILGQSDNPQEKAKQEESKKAAEILLEAIKNI